MALSEFEIIRRFFTARTRRALLGVGDDAAIVAQAVLNGLLLG